MRRLVRDRWFYSNSPDRDEPEKVSYAPFLICELSFFNALLSHRPFTPTSKAIIEIKIRALWLSTLPQLNLHFKLLCGSVSHFQNPVSKFVFCRAPCQDFGMKNNFIKIGKDNSCVFVSYHDLCQKEECGSWDWIPIVILTVISNITDQTKAEMDSCPHCSG